jgi:hypothetical protein
MAVAEGLMVMDFFAGQGQSKYQERQAKAAAARERKAAIIDRRAKALGGDLAQISTTRDRKALIARSRAAEAGIALSSAGGGLAGSSVAMGAKSSVVQQRGRETSFSLLTEDFGKQITDLNQKAADVRAGVGEEIEAPPTFFESIVTGASETAHSVLGGVTETLSEGLGDTLGGVFDPVAEGIGGVGDFVGNTVSKGKDKLEDWLGF